MKEIMKDIACISALFLTTYIGFHLSRANGIFKLAHNTRFHAAASQGNGKSFSTDERIDVHDAVGSAPSAGSPQAEEQANGLPANAQADKEANRTDLQSLPNDVAYVQIALFQRQQEEFMAQQQMARQNELQQLAKEEQNLTAQSIVDGSN